MNPEIPLNEALSKLETNIFDGTDINGKIVFSLPSMDNIRSYHDYIYYFNSINENTFWDSSVHGNIARQIKMAEPYLKKAHELFPYELWVEYWYAKMYLKDNNYKKTYEYLQIILNNPLVYSMQFYPDILDMAIQCTEKRGFNEQANLYRNQKTSLRNEYSIDVSFFHLFLD
jgi:predicted Zn-dependent protease